MQLLVRGNARLPLSEADVSLLVGASSCLSEALCNEPGLKELQLDGEEAGWQCVLEWLRDGMKTAAGRSAHTVSLILPIAHKYDVKPCMDICLDWLHSFVPSPVRQHPHYIVTWLRAAEDLQLDSVYQRLQTWFKSWELSAQPGHPLYALDWLAVADRQQGWGWLHTHCIHAFEPIPAHAAMPAALRTRMQRDRVSGLRSMLSDADGCSRLALGTVLQLARLPTVLLQAALHQDEPTVVLACNRAECGARLAVYRGQEGSHVREQVMCRPSLMEPLAQLEARAARDAACMCGGRFDRVVGPDMLI